MDKIKYIIDRRGRKRYPITHEKGVRDSDYMTLEKKLRELMGVVSEIMPLVVEGSVSSSAFSPGSGSSVPTFADAVEAFKHGPVILSYQDDGKACADMVVYADDDQLKTGNGVSWSANIEPDDSEPAVPEEHDPNENPNGNEDAQENDTGE